MSLNQPADATDPLAWDGSAYTGISFNLSITEMPSNVRLYVNLTDGTSYCIGVTQTKTSYTFLWGDLYTNCWDTTLTQTKLAGTALAKIKEITWQVGTNASGSMPFDFIVSNVKINP